jgi:transcriptional regulator with XRE-family HTH domain
MNVTGKELQSKRERAGLTREELAKILSVEYSTIWRWENNKRSISKVVVMALENVLRKPNGG